MNFPAITDFTNAKDYANAVGIPYDSGGELKTGEVYIANDTRFAASNYNVALTNFAVGGWANSGLEQELTAYVGAPVLVSRRFNYKVWANSEALKSETDDLRAVGAEFQEVRRGTSEVNTQTAPRGLIMVLDREELNAGVITEQGAVQYLTQRLQLNQIRRASALLIAAATDTARTWLTTTPDADMHAITAINAYQVAAGIDPNTAIYGRTAWLGRITALRGLTTAGGFAGAAKNESELAAFLNIDQVYRANALYQSATATKTLIGASKVLFYYKSMSGMQYDPSNIKYFYSPAPSGGRIEAFRYEEGSSKVIVGVRHNELLAITYSGGIQSLTIS